MFTRVIREERNVIMHAQSIDTQEEWSLKESARTVSEKPSIEAHPRDMHIETVVTAQSSFYQKDAPSLKNRLGNTSSAPRKKNSVECVLREYSPYKRKAKWILNSQGYFMRNWDALTTFGLVYTAIVTPVDVAFLEESIWSAMFWINQTINLIFFIDMIFQFFLPYETEGVVGISTVTNHKRIAIHYIKGYFFLDLCSILPLDTIGSATGSESMQRMKALRFLRLLRLLKMIRLLRASRIFARWQTTLAISYTTQSLWKFVLMLIIGAHWMGCLWGLVGLQLDGYTWIDALEDNKPFGMGLREPFNLYLASLHFAVMTITSIGYGDIAPQQRLEYIIAVVAQCVGGMLWVYSMGEVMVVISNLNPGNTQFKQRMDELNRMMRERRLPKEIRQRLRSFFLQSRELSQAERYTSLLKLMSPQLQGEVARSTHIRWISKVWYLRPCEGPGSAGISDFLIAKIAQVLKPRVYAQTEPVRSDDTLNVLMRGLASCHGRLLRAGETWGEDFILEHRPLRRLNTVIALTFIEVQELHRHVFQDILEHFATSADYAFIRKAVVKLACIRGIVLHARYIRQQRRMEEAGELGKLNRLSVQAAPIFVPQSAHSRRDNRCFSADTRPRQSTHSSALGSGMETFPVHLMEEFKKEMRTIVRSEIALANHPERSPHPHRTHTRDEGTRAIPNERFGDEIATFFKMPTRPFPNPPSPSPSSPSLPGQLGNHE